MNMCENYFTKPTQKSMEWVLVSAHVKPGDTAITERASSKFRKNFGYEKPCRNGPLDNRWQALLNFGIQEM